MTRIVKQGNGYRVQKSCLWFWQDMLLTVDTLDEAIALADDDVFISLRDYTEPMEEILDKLDGI